MPSTTHLADARTWGELCVEGSGISTLWSQLGWEVQATDPLRLRNSRTPEARRRLIGCWKRLGVKVLVEFVNESQSFCKETYCVGMEYAAAVVTPPPTLPPCMRLHAYEPKCGQAKEKPIVAVTWFGIPRAASMQLPCSSRATSMRVPVSFQAARMQLPSTSPLQPPRRGGRRAPLPPMPRPSRSRQRAPAQSGATEPQVRPSL